MTADISLIEMTGEISAAQEGRETFFTPRASTAIWFTLFHKGDFAWAGMRVLVENPADIRTIHEEKPIAGSRIRVHGYLVFHKKNNRWIILVPMGKTKGLTLLRNNPLLGLGSDGMTRKSKQ